MAQGSVRSNDFFICIVRGVLNPGFPEAGVRLPRKGPLDSAPEIGRARSTTGTYGPLLLGRVWLLINETEDLDSWKDCLPPP